MYGWTALGLVSTAAAPWLGLLASIGLIGFLLIVGIALAMLIIPASDRPSRAA